MQATPGERQGGKKEEESRRGRPTTARREEGLGRSRGTLAGRDLEIPNIPVEKQEIDGLGGPLLLASVAFIWLRE